MPGVVPLSTATTVFPLLFTTSLTQVREWAGIENNYPDGSWQRSIQVATGLKKWVMAFRLTPALAATLRAFYDACSGPLTPFWFYDPLESTAPYNWDETGANEDGRFLVRFNSPWREEVVMTRVVVQLEMIELASESQEV